MRFQFLPIAFVLIFVPISLAQETGDKNRPGLSLKETYDLYLRCIDRLDVDGLMSTVTDGPEFLFLTSSGSKINSVEDYRRFHEEWFAETGWMIAFEMLEIREGVEYGYVLSTYRYEGRGPDGEPYKSVAYFTLIFQKEGGMWKVILDQITPIRPAQ